MADSTMLSATSQEEESFELVEKRGDHSTNLTASEPKAPTDGCGRYVRPWAVLHHTQGMTKCFVQTIHLISLFSVCQRRKATFLRAPISPIAITCAGCPL